MVFINLNNLTTLNLAYNSIYQLTDQTFQGLNSLINLNIGNNFLKSLNKSLVSIKTLRSVDLSNNRIQNDKELFYFDSKVSNYEYFLKNTTNYLIRQIQVNSASKLDLSFNDLSVDIYNISFKEMADRLVYLDLRQTGLKMYSVDSLNVLKQLTFIDLSENELRFRGKLLTYSVNLNTVKLSNINLTTSEFESFLDLKSFSFLSYVDLSKNNLETVKIPHFQYNKKLKFLNLSQNRIQFIENRAFQSAEQFSVLDVSFNCLKSLSKFIFLASGSIFMAVNVKLQDFKALEIHAASNKIQLFDLTFKLMPMTNLSGNMLTEIPAYINTRILDMSFNFVSSITKDSFVKMTSLFELYAPSNLIKTIEIDSFLNQNSLDLLDLSNNSLSRLENDTLCGLWSLRTLNLAHNSIQALHLRFFRQLVNLEIFYLNSNPIKFIEDDTFLKLKFLKVLNLDSYDPIDHSPSSSRLKISNSTFKGLSSIKRLVIYQPITGTLEGLRYVEVNLRPVVKDDSLGLNYFGSINVVYSIDSFTDWECFVVLYSIRQNIQINLMNDTSKERFLISCGMHSLNELKQIIDYNLML
jgi:Leucine-rich repeat (LRR) protein